MHRVIDESDAVVGSGGAASTSGPAAARAASWASRRTSRTRSVSATRRAVNDSSSAGGRSGHVVDVGDRVRVVGQPVEHRCAAADGVTSTEPAAVGSGADADDAGDVATDARWSPPPTSRPRSISVMPNSRVAGLVGQAVEHEPAVAGLEHVQRQHLARQHHAAQREHRQTAHRPL